MGFTPVDPEDIVDAPIRGFRPVAPEDIIDAPIAEESIPQGYGELLSKSAVKGTTQGVGGLGYIAALLGDKATDFYNNYTDPFGMRNIKSPADAQEAMRTGVIPNPGSTYLRDAVTPAMEATEAFRTKVIGDPNPTGAAQRYAGKAAEYLPTIALPGGPLWSRILSALGGAVGGQTALEIGLPEWAGALPGSLLGPGGLAAAGKAAELRPAAQVAKAKEAARQIVRDTVDAPKALEALEMRAGQEAGIPLEIKVQETYLPQYQRTAERVGDTNTAAIEEALSRADPATKEAIAIQDAKREGARSAIFAEQNPNPRLDSQVGDAIRKDILDNYEQARGRVSAASKEAFSGDSAVSTVGAKQVVTDNLKSFLADGSKKVSKEFTDLVDNFNALPETAPLETLQNYRASFGSFTNPGAGATTADKWTADLARKIRKEIDDQVNIAVESGTLAESQKDAWRRMVKARKYQGETFEDKAVGSAIERSNFNSGYELAAEKIPGKLLSTRESARQAIEALSGKEGGKEALRSSLLTNLWDGSTSQVWDPAKNAYRQEVNLASFNRGLRNIEEVAPEVLTPSTRDALRVISEDKASNIAIKDRAFRASKRNSVTSESESMIRYIEKAIEQENSTAARKIIKGTPLIGDWLDILMSKVADPQKRSNLIKKELSEFVLNPMHAREMLKTPAKAKKSIVEAFGNRIIQGAGIAGAAGALSSTNAEGQQRSAPKTESEKISYLIEEAQNEMDGIPPTPKPSATEQLLKAVALQESGGNPDAVSSAGAIGLHQIMPATAKEIAKELGMTKYDLKDPETNTIMAKHYLGKLLDMFDGDTELALAAYHSGPGRIKNLLKLHGGTTLADIRPYLGPVGRVYASGVLSKLKKIEKNGVFEA